MGHDMKHHMQHELYKVKHMKHFFVKSFWVSFLLLVVFGLLAVLTFDFQISLAERFYGLDSDDYAKIMCTVMGIWKVLIIQFTLVPAIVSCFIVKHIEKYHMGENGDTGGCGTESCGCS